MRDREFWFYWIAVGLVAVTALSDLWWISVDLGSRLGLIHAGVGDFDAEAFTASLTIWNDLAFYTHTITGIGALWMLLDRSRHVFLVYVVSISASVADQLMLINNPYYQAELLGQIVLTLHILAMILITGLRGSRYLR